VREQMGPVIELVRGYLVADYDFPSAIEAMRLDIEAASREVLDGLTGEALEEMRAANAVNRRMAPLTPDHHFYIDQGANAHLRLVLIEIGRKLVAAGRLGQPDDVMFLRYNELRALIGSGSAIAAREIVAARRLEREAAQRLHPRDWIGTATPSQLAFPYLVNWGYPDRFHQQQSDDQRIITGLGASPGTIEGIARVVRTIDEFDEVRDGDILVCQMTNPAWVVLFTKIAGLVTDTGGTTSHPAVLAREFGIPAVIGTSVATQRIVTGDRLTVDGTTGRVEILRDGAGDATAAPAAAIGR
jgi:phosphohistidine swiveling domain-containing protein